jgi:hypothetical protein
MEIPRLFRPTEYPVATANKGTPVSQDCVLEHYFPFYVAFGFQFTETLKHLQEFIAFHLPLCVEGVN